MTTNQRKARRTRLDRRCWVVEEAGEPRRECLVEDISETGARIALAPGQTLPKKFDLHLSSAGAVARRAEVVWQTSTEAGLRFIDRPKRKNHPGVIHPRAAGHI